MNRETGRGEREKERNTGGGREREREQQLEDARGKGDQGKRERKRANVAFSLFLSPLIYLLFVRDSSSFVYFGVKSSQGDEKIKRNGVLVGVYRKENENN